MEVGKVGFNSIPKQAFKAEQTDATNLLDKEAPSDSLELGNKKSEPPKISRLRLMFNYLSDEQVKAVNESRRLPDNGKFVSKVGGGYTISNNFFGFRAGTKELPVGFEMKRGFLGFAKVVPIGTEGAFIR